MANHVVAVAQVVDRWCHVQTIPVRFPQDFFSLSLSNNYVSLKKVHGGGATLLTFQKEMLSNAALGEAN